MFLGHHAHGQVFTNKKLNVVSVLTGDFKVAAHLPNDFRPDFAVVSASAFADVMVEKGNNQTPASFHRHHELGAKRQLVGVFTVCEVSEVTNRKEGVLIHRIGVE